MKIRRHIVRLSTSELNDIIGALRCMESDRCIGDEGLPLLALADRLSARVNPDNLT